MVLERLTHRLYMLLGKKATSKRCKIWLTRLVSRMHVCVGDMNAEDGEKLIKELPG